VLILKLIHNLIINNQPLYLKFKVILYQKKKKKKKKKKKILDYNFIKIILLLSNYVIMNIFLNFNFFFLIIIYTYIT